MFTKFMFSITAVLLMATMAMSQTQLQKELSNKGKVSPYGIVGQKAPKLEVKQWIDKEGNVTEPIHLSDYEGKFIVIYNFQAWCPGCHSKGCLLYTSPSPRDQRGSRMPSSA